MRILKVIRIKLYVYIYFDYVLPPAISRASSQGAVPVDGRWLYIYTLYVFHRRVVIVGGDKGCPCGGTHVKNTNEIKKMTVRKLKVKKGRTKISYDVEP